MNDEFSYTPQQQPLFPSWATDADISKAVEEIEYDFWSFIKYCNYQSSIYGPRLADETEAWLNHQVNGW